MLGREIHTSKTFAAEVEITVKKSKGSKSTGIDMTPAEMCQERYIL